VHEFFANVREALANLLAAMAGILLACIVALSGGLCLFFIHLARYLLVPLIVLSAIVSPLPMSLLQRIRFEIRFWLAYTSPDRLPETFRSMKER
jgi:ABC-type nitrate/sulfonate/bicarbonate transport system permease component